MFYLRNCCVIYVTGRCQAIIWTNAGILFIGLLETNFIEIYIWMQSFSFKKKHLKVLSGKWRPFCLGLTVLMLPGFLILIWFTSCCRWVPGCCDYGCGLWVKYAFLPINLNWETLLETNDLLPCSPRNDGTAGLLSKFTSKEIGHLYI